MKGQFIICRELKIAFLLVQFTTGKGVVAGYSQVLLNAMICAFFTICKDLEVSIEEHSIGYNGWIDDSGLEDFGYSEILKKYISVNPNTWFCKIIKEYM